MSATAAAVLSCFENLIAIDGQCSESAPSSGVYLRTLGVTRSEISSYLTGEYTNEQQLFSDSFQAAIHEVVASLHNHFSPKYRTISFLTNQRVGLFQDDLKIVSGTSGSYKGVNIKLNQRTSYMALAIESLSLHLDYTGDITIRIFDLIQGAELKSIVIPVVSGEIAVTHEITEILSEKKMINIFIGYDSTGIDSHKTLLTAGCASCSGSQDYSNRFLSVRACSIPTSGQIINANLKSVSDTGGLSVTYSLSCDHRSWVCSVSQRLALGIGYKTCAKILETAMYQSSNEQFNVRISGEEAKKELQERVDLYNKKGDSFIHDNLKNIALPQDDMCFSCKRNVMVKTLIPS